MREERERKGNSLGKAWRGCVCRDFINIVPDTAWHGEILMAVCLLCCNLKLSAKKRFSV